MFKSIHYHLDDFEFAQAKKLVKIDGGARFISQRDDLFPFIKYQKEVVVKPLEHIRNHIPIVYLSDKSLKLGFITGETGEDIRISTVKGYPEQWVIKRKFLLGRVHFAYPDFWFKFRLKRYLKSEKYRLLR